MARSLLANSAAIALSARRPHTNAMKTVGNRHESGMAALATGALLAEGARFSESVSHLAKTTFVPKGVYRYKYHEAANQHAQDCLVQGMAQLAAERV